MRRSWGIQILRRGLSFSKNIPRVGDVKEHLNPIFIDDPGKYIHEINRARHETLGPMYIEKIGPDVEALFVADPDFVQKMFSLESKYPKHFVPQAWNVYGELRKRKRGLFFLEGQEWLNMRRELNPLLLKNESLEQLRPFLEIESERFLNSIERKTTPPPKLSSQQYSVFKDLPQELNRWSIRSILAVLFGNANPSSSLKQAENELIRGVQEIFDASSKLQFVSAENACREKTPDWMVFENALDKVFEIINESLLCRHISRDSLTGMMKSNGMKMSDIERIAIDFIIAAADTTATTTLWTIHLASIYPTVQEKIRMASSIKDLRYLHHCLKEASRLYPVAPFITRIPDTNLDIFGTTLHSGQLVLISTYAMSRNDMYFYDANEFRPERWNDTPMSFASLPFGFRARSCIGKKLAEISMESLICGLFKNYKTHCLNYERADMIMKYIGLPDRTIKIGLEKIY